MRNFRRMLASIILAAPIGGCLPGSCPKFTPIEETITIGNMPDADLAPLVADCKNPTGDCVPLCDEVYRRQHGSLPTYTPTTCEMATDTVTGEDAVHYFIESRCIGGRRPTGYRNHRGEGDACGAYLAEQAELEAASIRAFGDLHDDLVALGAPASLRRATIAAASDELDHAATCDRLARRYGVEPAFEPAIGDPARRTRLELAIDNAVEGCVRETYGAVVAGYQARAAHDPEVRRAMARIAKDETKHAALSWRLHQWLLPQLSAAERAEVTAAMSAARADLRAAIKAEMPEVHHLVGLPSVEAAHAMLADLDAQVWSRAA